MKTPVFLLFLLFHEHVPVHATNAQIKYKSFNNSRTVTIECGEVTEGPVTWSRDRNGTREDILTIEAGGYTIKHVDDKRKQYNTKGLSLMIIRPSPFNAGLYYCNSSSTTAVVCLTMTSAADQKMKDLDKCKTALTSSEQPVFTVAERWIALIVVGVVVLLLVLVSLSSKKICSKMEGDCELAYDDVFTSIEYVTFNKEQTGRCTESSEATDH